MLVCLIRSVILYFLLILAIRLMGKRQIGELEPSEFVVAMLLADLAAVPMQDLGIPLLSGIVPILTILAIEILLSVLSYHFIGFRKLFCGTPVVLIENGTILQKNLKMTRVTTNELMEQLREKGYLDLSTIQYAILETNGQISAIVDSMTQPVSRQDMKLQPRSVSLPVTLISDGKLLQKNLAQAGFDEKALHKLLKKDGLTIPDVFLLTADADGNIYLARKQG